MNVHTKNAIQDSLTTIESLVFKAKSSVKANDLDNAAKCIEYAIRDLQIVQIQVEKER
jgi:hypothetical protein